MIRRRQTFVAALAFTTITALMLPSLAGAWGANAHRPAGK